MSFTLRQNAGTDSSTVGIKLSAFWLVFLLARIAALLTVLDTDYSYKRHGRGLSLGHSRELRALQKCKHG